MAKVERRAHSLATPAAPSKVIVAALALIVTLGFALSFLLPEHNEALTRVRGTARTVGVANSTAQTVVGVVDSTARFVGVVKSPAQTGTELRDRICGRSDSQQPWYDECCASSVILLDAAQPPRPHSLLPSFSCPNSEGSHTRVPCAWVRDGLCDCVSDGSDEPESGACHEGYFFCPSGPKMVSGGSLVPIPQDISATPQYRAAADAARKGQTRALWGLGFIPAALVHDGVEDCTGGEDERTLSATGSASLRRL